MRYALFIDWENLWIEHLGRCFPAYVSDHVAEQKKRLERDRKQAITLPKLPEAKHLDAAAIRELSLFPRVLMDVCTQVFGARPAVAIATAIWEHMPLASEINMQEQLKNQGIIPTRPTIDTSRTKKFHLKNASDYKLTLDVMRTLLLEKPADRKSGKTATTRESIPFERVVLISGDFMFGQLLDFAKDVLGVRPHLLTFLHSLAGSLHEKVKAPKFAGCYRRLELESEYAAHRLRCLTLDPLHAHKLAAPEPVDRLLTMTAIKRLKDRDLRKEHHVGTTRDTFLEWLEQWMNYWSLECSIHPLYTADQALTVLEAKQVIYLKYQKRAQYVWLRSNGYLQEYADLSICRKYAFEHLFDVPPVHFTK